MNALFQNVFKPTKYGVRTPRPRSLPSDIHIISLNNRQRINNILILKTGLGCHRNILSRITTC